MVQPVMMKSTAEARHVIEEIQRLYYLHPEDVLVRSENPESFETNRQTRGIKRLEGTLDL